MTGFIMQFKWLVMVLFVGCFFSTNVIFGAPVVTSVNPYFGPSTGGTAVTITGSGFTGATNVKFGTTPATTFNVQSDSLITATSPASSPQVVVISVTTPSGTSAFSPDAYFTYQGNQDVYVANCGVNTVTVIDSATNTITAIPPVGEQPNAIAITPDGNQAYVANFVDGTVSVIEAATHLVGSTIVLGGTPDATAITPNGMRVYTVDFSNNRVWMINTTSQLATPIAVGDLPITIAITPNGMKAYVVNWGSNTVSAINILANTVNTILVGGNPLGIAITPDGTAAFVTNSSDGTVSVINTANDAVSTPIKVGTSASAIAITPDGTKAYVVNPSDNTVSVINTASHTVIATISVGMSPTAIAITPDGTKAYVTNSADNTVSVINTANNMVISTIMVGLDPLAIAIIPDGTKAYVINFDSDTISVINTLTDTIIGGPIAEGNQTTALAIPADQAPLAKFKVTIAPVGSASQFDASASISPIGTIVKYAWNFGDGTTLETTSPIASHAYVMPGTYTVSLTVTNSAGTSTRQIFNISSFFNFFSNANNSTFITNQGGPSAVATQEITIPSLVPMITDLNPNFGPTTGGTVVTITGIHFTGTTAVLFGTTPALSFIVNSDTSITATAPPGVPGTVDVRVITALGGISPITPSDQYTYLSPIIPLPPRDLRARQVKNEFATQTDLINILTWKAPTGGAAPVAFRIYRDSKLTELAAVIPAHEKLQFKDHNRKKGRTYRYFVVTVDQVGNLSAPASVVVKG